MDKVFIYIHTETETNRNKLIYMLFQVIELIPGGSHMAVTVCNNLIYKAITNQNNLICMLFIGNRGNTRWIPYGGNKL